MLWSAIGLACALLLLVLLGSVSILPPMAVKICGTILIWLCSMLMLTAVVYATKFAVNKS